MKPAVLFRWQQVAMSRRTRIFLIIIGLLLLAVAIAALTYALIPARVLHEVTPIAPTVFTLPPGGAP
jgi:hypothetical protein